MNNPPFMGCCAWPAFHQHFLMFSKAKLTVSRKKTFMLKPMIHYQFAASQYPSIHTHTQSGTHNSDHLAGCHLLFRSNHVLNTNGATSEASRGSVSYSRILQHIHCRCQGQNLQPFNYHITTLPPEHKNHSILENQWINRKKQTKKEHNDTQVYQIFLHVYCIYAYIRNALQMYLTIPHIWQYSVDCSVSSPVIKAFWPW